MGVPEEILGWSFNGSGKVIDSSPKVLSKAGLPHNKVAALFDRQTSFVHLKDS